MCVCVVVVVVVVVVRGGGGGGCNHCGLISHWRQRNGVRRDYYPTNGEKEN